MSKQIDALKLALEALLWANKEINGWKDDAYGYEPEDHPEIMSALTAIKEALAQPEQEPVAFPRQAGDSTWTVDTAFIWRVKHTIDPDTPHDFIPSEEQIETVLLALERIPSGIYTSPPPQRTWVGLTDEEMQDLWDRYAHMEMMRAIEAKLKEKNT